MTSLLAWLGRHAPAALAVGIALCFVIPAASALLRPALPLLVCLVLGLAMARIELGSTLRAALSPPTLMRLVLISLALMPLCGALFVGLSRLFGLDPGLIAALVYLAAAPPIASAAALCFIMGYNARLALEITLAATLLTPVLGPLTVALLLPEAPDLAMGALALRLGAMIAGAVLVALAIRRLAGPERLARNAAVMDGLGVIALVVFVVPLFDGVPAQILADPALALGVAALAILANLGTNLALVTGLGIGFGGRIGRAEAGALGIVFANRTIAMYLAAVPPEPRLALFVALYQVPMLLTPMVLRGLARHRRGV